MILAGPARQPVSTLPWVYCCETREFNKYALRRCFDESGQCKTPSEGQAVHDIFSVARAPCQHCVGFQCGQRFTYGYCRGAAHLQTGHVHQLPFQRRKCVAGTHSRLATCAPSVNHDTIDGLRTCSPAVERYKHYAHTMFTAVMTHRYTSERSGPLLARINPLLGACNRLQTSCASQVSKQRPSEHQCCCGRRAHGAPHWCTTDLPRGYTAATGTMHLYSVTVKCILWQGIEATHSAYRRYSTNRNGCPVGNNCTKCAAAQTCLLQLQDTSPTTTVRHCMSSPQRW